MAWIAARLEPAAQVELLHDRVRWLDQDAADEILDAMEAARTGRPPLPRWVRAALRRYRAENEWRRRR